MFSFPSVASLLLKKYHGGYVVIRLALAGHKQANRPFYRIVAAYNKRARDGKYIEQLGSYDPLPNIYNEKLVSFNFDRIKYWIGCGAHPSKPVAKLLGVYSLHLHVLSRRINIAQFYCEIEFHSCIVICLVKEVCFILFYFKPLLRLSSFILFKYDETQMGIKGGKKS